MHIEEFLFPGIENSSLSARIYSDNPGSKNGIIFSHGLFSSMDGYKITRLANDIVSRGYDLMTFNFSSAENFNGSVRNISVLKQVSELGCAVDAFRKRGICRLHFMGSSMGAAVTILYAASAPLPVETLVLIAAPIDLPAIIPGMTPERILGLDDSGYYEISGIRVNNGFFKELVLLEMIDAVKMINCPVLLIHGKEDSVVSFSNFSLFVSNCKTDCTQLVIEHGDHNLTTDHDLALIRENIIKWFGDFYA